ncbi:haloalkane dehalogenase [uncultured Ferrimonas sp.]|uniref:haloalkane dehalogenase n=1 Tax=uncultured Ferrimonas sp. TaxID=432640 RepID=UPI00263407EA|nr:haloalkane dehalogenase [uncultured Ferrimonas sp.]
MATLRTPEHRFADLPDFPFAPHYHQIDDPQFGPLRLHYLDEGPRDGKVILCLHGEPSWCFLYRKMIPILTAAGYRVLAPDLIGFGRSDKLSDIDSYSYQRHLDWLQHWLDGMQLQEMVLIAQDWGGLLGLRLVSAQPERFSHLSLANTGLPTGDLPMQEAFLKWQHYALTVPEFDAGAICGGLIQHNTATLADDVVAAYRAPFPDQSYLAAARAFPSLVPTQPTDPENSNNRAAWAQLQQWHKPVLLCFSDGDPVTRGGDKIFQKLVPGCANQPHLTLHGGHFIQEHDGQRWAHAVVAWLQP